MKTLTMTCLSALLVCTPVVHAQEEEPAITGQELLDTCNTDTSACMQYIGGLVSMVSMFQQMDPSQPKVFCVDPAKTQLPEVANQVHKWLGEKPDRLPEDAYKLVTESLNQHYPCSL